MMKVGSLAPVYITMLIYTEMCDPIKMWDPMWDPIAKLIIAALVKLVGQI